MRPRHCSLSRKNLYRIYAVPVRSRVDHRRDRGDFNPGTGGIVTLKDRSPSRDQEIELLVGADSPKKRVLLNSGAANLIRQVALVPVLLVVLIVGAFASPYFLTVNNIAGIGQQISALAVTVVGESLILLIGGMDLSLESTYGLAPMVAAWMILPISDLGNGLQLSPFVGILILLLVGAVAGLVHGFLIVK